MATFAKEVSTKKKKERKKRKVHGRRVGRMRGREPVRKEDVLFFDVFLFYGRERFDGISCHDSKDWMEETFRPLSCVRAYEEETLLTQRENVLRVIACRSSRFRSLGRTYV